MHQHLVNKFVSLYCFMSQLLHLLVQTIDFFKCYDFLEYATGSEPSKHGDRYSYGFLLLEMYTGRSPTNEIFNDDFNLHNFVKMALPERLAEIVDSALLLQETEEGAARNNNGRNYSRRRGTEMSNTGLNEIGEEEGNINFNYTSRIISSVQHCLVSVLEIGLACSEYSPKERMNMADVIRELQRIRSAYMAAGLGGRRQRAR